MCAESLYTATDMTVEDYLYGCVGYAIPEEALNTILVDRGIEHGASVSALDKRTKELCKADLYMWCVNSPSVFGNIEDSNGVWKHKEGGSQTSASDKKHLLRMANRIYKKYGELASNSGIRMKSFGMKVFR